MTAQRRHLPNAPITEALVDFRVPPFELRPESRAALEVRLAAQYPQVEELHQVETQLGIAEGRPVSPSTTQRLRGFAFRSQAAPHVAQFRFDGFTFNRLPSYVDFEEMQVEALRLWAVYVEVFRPQNITRVAVRYINHLLLPTDAANLTHYLTAPPKPPPGTGYQVNGLFSRVSMIDPPTGINAHVTQALEQSLAPGQLTVILDVDVYRTGEYEVHDARLTPLLARLREMKNEIFFSSITEEAAQLWQ